MQICACHEIGLIETRNARCGRPPFGLAARDQVIPSRDEHDFCEARVGFTVSRGLLSDPPRFFVGISRYLDIVRARK